MKAALVTLVVLLLMAFAGPVWWLLRRGPRRPVTPRTAPVRAAVTAGTGPVTTAAPAAPLIPAQPTADVPTAAASPTAPDVPTGPYGPGSAAPRDDGSAPSPEFRVKANASSRLYHAPESPYYKRTKAQAWFRTAEDAEAAGFQHWDRRRRRD